MATPAPGTIPALPQYQPGALPLTGQEILEIASSATATSAISAQMPLTDVVGKVPSVMTAAVPSINDLVAFFQVSSGLPRQTAIGNLGQAAGNLPIAGNTGQLLAKNSGANFDDSWYSLSTFLVAGTGMTTAGSTTVTVGIANFGVGSAQIATNAVGNVQFRQGSPLSVVGVPGAATANIADVVAGGGGLVLQSNAAGTGLLWGAINLASAIITGVVGVPNGGTGTSTLTAHAVLLGAGTSTLQLAAATAAGDVLIDQGASANPAFMPVSGAFTISAAGTTSLANIAQQILTTGSVYTTVTSVREVYIGTTTMTTVKITAATAWFAADTNGLPLIVADVTGTASAHNITLNFLNDTCNGTNTLKITTNYGGYRLRPLSSGNWVIV